jgi:Rrf2 family protein
MKISHKTLYAIHFLVALAEQANHSKSPLQLREIAERGNLPFKFLEQIALSLKGAGWIRGQRGKEGGYSLSITASQLKLGDIVRRLEGTSSLWEGGDDSDVQNVLGSILQRCQTAVDDILDNISLSDLLIEIRERRIPGFDYVI